MQFIGKNISQKLLDTVPEFSGDVVRDFKLLNGEVDIETREEVFGVMRSISCHDIIRDPFTGNTCEIGVAEEISPEGHVLRWHNFAIVSPSINEPMKGVFTLSGQNFDHQEVFKFLWLTNKNSANANRAINVKAEFTYIDAKKNSKEILKRGSILKQALEKADTMDKAQLTEVCLAMGWNTKKDTDVLRAQIMEYAENYPVEFLEKFDNPAKANQADIKRALDQEIIRYDISQHRIVWGHNNETVAILPRQEGKSTVELFQSWVDNAKNGDSTMKAIKKRIKEPLEA